jgi:TP901 family phage tail tape measure protein
MTRRETAQVDVIINGEKAGSTLKELQQNTRQLYRELQTLPVGSDEFKKKLEELNAAKKNLKDITGAVQETENSFQSFIQKAAGLAGIQIGLQAVVSSVMDFGQKAVENFVEFEASLAELSSITGVTGKDLDFFAQQAELIGSTTQSSAIQAVEAFKLLGSAVPSLLANKEALASVTKEAIILAEASGIKLPEAANAMASALNMFQLPASQSARIINALAAGSKAGAVEVPQVTDALKSFGVAASSFNVSFEQSVALVETLGEYSIKGAEAGTSLRNVLNKMATAKALPKEAIEELQKFGVNTDLVMNKQVPFNQRLREFSKIGGDAVAITKVFGAENKIAGEILLNNVDKVEGYTKAVTGTNTAYEQQAINADTTKAKLQILKNEFEATATTVGGVLLNSFFGFIEILKTYKVTLLLLVAAYVIYNGQILVSWVQKTAENVAKAAGLVIDRITLIVTTGLTLAKGLLTASTRAATIAQIQNNIAQAANPIGAIITLIIAAVTAIYAWTQANNENTAALEKSNNENAKKEKLQKDINELEKDAAKSIREQKADFAAKISYLQTLNVSDETRKKLIGQINSQYKDYLPSLIKESDSMAEIARKTDIANAAFDRRIKIMTNEAVIKRYTEEIASLNVELDKAQDVKIGANTGKGGFLAEGFAAEAEKTIKRTKEEIDTYEQRVLERMKNAPKDEKPTIVSSAGGDDDKQNKEREKKQKEYADNVKKAQKEINEMRIAAMEEGFVKEMAKLDAHTAERIEKLVGTPQQIDEQTTLIYEEWLRKRQEYELKFDELDELRAKKDKENQEKAKKELLEKSLSDIEEEYAVATAKEAEEWALKNLNDKDFKQAIEEDDFLAVQEVEMDREKALFDMKQDFQNKKLNSLILAGKGETSEAKKIGAQILGDQVDFNKKMVKDEADAKEKKRLLIMQGLDHAKMGVNTFIELLSKDEGARKKNAATIKALQAGNVLIDGVKEVSGIWAGWSNFGPAGVAIAAIKTAFAAARTLSAIQKINSTEFAQGGFFRTAKNIILPMQKVGDSYQYARGGMVANGSSHADGGISLTDNRTGQHIGEIEGGEPIMVLSKPTYLNNKSIVDALLNTSLHRSGAPIRKFADGGLIDTSGTIPVNIPEQNTNVADERMLQEIMGLRDDIRAFNGRLRAFVVYQDIKDTEAEITLIESKNTI